MKIKYLYFRICLSILLFSGKNKEIDVNNFIPRNNNNARLEVKDKVIHGAGQSPEAFNNYYKIMDNSTKPLIYMTYINLNDSIEKYFINLSNEMIKYKNNYDVYLIPQIGLQMTTDSKPENHYEHKVANGDYDKILMNFCNKLKQLG